MDRFKLSLHQFELASTAHLLGQISRESAQPISRYASQCVWTYTQIHKQTNIQRNLYALCIPATADRIRFRFAGSQSRRFGYDFAEPGYRLRSVVSETTGSANRLREIRILPASPGTKEVAKPRIKPVWVAGLGLA